MLVKYMFHAFVKDFTICLKQNLFISEIVYEHI